MRQASSINEQYCTHSGGRLSQYFQGPSVIFGFCSYWDVSSAASLQGGEKEKLKLAATTSPLHPALRRALESIEPVFAEMLEEQGWLDTPERWTKILELIGDEELRETLSTRVSIVTIFAARVRFVIRMGMIAVGGKAQVEGLSAMGRPAQGAE